MTSERNIPTGDNARVLWYVTRDEQQALLHLHIYAPGTLPYDLPEQRQEEKSADFFAVAPNQLESYFRLSLQTRATPLRESGTRDTYHALYLYSPELHSSIAFIIDELSTATPNAEPRTSRINACA